MPIKFSLIKANEARTIKQDPLKIILIRGSKMKIFSINFEVDLQEDVEEAIKTSIPKISSLYLMTSLEAWEEVIKEVEAKILMQAKIIPKILLLNVTYNSMKL